MKTSLMVLLILSFAVVAVFGVFGMPADMQNHDGNCIAAVAQGTDCPKQSGFLGYIAFHFNALRSFSLAAFNDSSFVSFSLLFLLIVVIGLRILHGNLASPKLYFAYHYLYRPELFGLLPKRKLLRWLALHENSPAFH